MTGKICMVTGATSGIGRVTALVLAAQGATVVGVGRSQEKNEKTVSQIKTLSGNNAVTYLLADLSVQQEIRQLAETFKQRYQRLDVLVNNAGAIFLKRQLSADDIEMTFALNHLGYFLLTNLLLDTLKASASARIVNVSSDAHHDTTINFDDLQGEKRYKGFRAYSQSKLANVLFTYELARRLEETGVTANAVHPGMVATNFGKNNGWYGPILRKILNLFSISKEKGADTVLYLATSPEVEGVTGKYFVKKKAIPSSQASYNRETAQRLWQISAEMTGLTNPS